MATPATSLSDRVARLEGDRKHLATTGELYRALLIHAGIIVSAQIGLALFVVRAVQQ